jgi:ribosomal protein S27E
MHKCPRQEKRAWTPDDELEVECPGCDQSLEFFQDEQKRKCRNCGQMVINPKAQDVV